MSDETSSGREQPRVEWPPWIPEECAYTGPAALEYEKRLRDKIYGKGKPISALFETTKAEKKVWQQWGHKGAIVEITTIAGPFAVKRYRRFPRRWMASTYCFLRAFFYMMPKAFPTWAKIVPARDTCDQEEPGR